MQYLGHTYTKNYSILQYSLHGNPSRGQQEGEELGGEKKQVAEKSGILGCKSDLRFRGLQDQGTRKRIINGLELGYILWQTHLYVKLNNMG